LYIKSQMFRGTGTIRRSLHQVWWRGSRRHHRSAAPCRLLSIAWQRPVIHLRSMNRGSTGCR
jgi:hypothetical protein